MHLSFIFPGRHLVIILLWCLNAPGTTAACELFSVLEANAQEVPLDDYLRVGVKYQVGHQAYETPCICGVGASLGHS